MLLILLLVSPAEQNHEQGRVFVPTLLWEPEPLHSLAHPSSCSANAVPQEGSLENPLCWPL